MNDNLKLAHEFVVKMHEEQLRKFTGEPYIKHLEETAQFLWEYFPDISNDDLIAGLLHDVVEDTSAEAIELGHLFGGCVMSLVIEVSNDEKEKKKIGTNTYMSNKINNLSERAFSIKLCDRLSNILALDNILIPDSFIEYYGNKTIFILLNLNREITETQRQIIDRISAMLNYLGMVRNITYKGE